MLRLLKNIRIDRRGVTAVEYALIATIMGGLIVTAVTALGGGISSSFSTIAQELTTASSGL